MALFPFNSFCVTPLYKREKSTYSHLTCVFRSQSNRSYLARIGECRGGRIHWQISDIARNWVLAYLFKQLCEGKKPIRPFTTVPFSLLPSPCTYTQGISSLVRRTVAFLSLLMSVIITICWGLLLSFLYFNTRPSRVALPYSKRLSPITPITIYLSRHQGLTAKACSLLSKVTASWSVKLISAIVAAHVDGWFHRIGEQYKMASFLPTKLGETIP